MKICIIHFCYSPYEFGGSPRSVRITAESLKKRGHEVFVITTGPYKNLKSLKPSIRMENGIKVYYFYPFFSNIYFYTNTKSNNFSKIFGFLLNFWNPHTYFVVRKILKKENPDVVSINGVFFLSLSVYSAAKSLNFHIVHTIRGTALLFLSGNPPYLDKIMNIRPLFRSYKLHEIIDKTYRTITKIIINHANPKITIFPTRSIKEIYLRYGFFRNSKNVVIPNIIYINNINLKDEKITNKKTFDIMYCGGFQRHKGGQTLIKAFRKIKNPNIRLHVFGGGLKNAEEDFKKLVAGDERIIFYGEVPNEVIRKFYETVDVVVFPSICYEAFGRVIIESFSCGVPVIGSNVGAIPELIQENYNGFLFEPGNVEQLKEILEYVIVNRDKLKEMSENCINTAKKYSVENNIYKLEEIYKEAAKLTKK